MTTIDYSNTTPTTHFERSIDASELGLAPGQFPRTLAVDPKFGNGRPLIRHHDMNSSGELIGVYYYQDLGTMAVVVWND